MNKLKIALDVDGIIANFYLAMCKKYNKPYQLLDTWNGAEWITDKFSFIANDYKFWGKDIFNLNPPESLNFDFDLYLTHCPMSQARAYWLGYNGFPKKDLVCTGEKIEYMIKNNIDILIDDKPDTIRKVLKAEKIAIQYFPEYMSQDFIDNCIIEFGDYDNYYTEMSLPRIGKLLKTITYE